jgi:hypothetical protein
MKIPFRCCKALISTAVFLVLFSLPGFDRSDAYILPAEQLLQFMAVHFSKFDTFVVKQAVERESQEGTKAFEETLFMKRPDLLRSQSTETSIDQDGMIDRSYEKLFLAGSRTGLTDLLTEAGVDLGQVSYTRVHGTVAYLIGGRSPDSPRIAVEKERFLPLLFVYPSRLLPGRDLIEVNFLDYRKVGQGWYPFEILYKSSEGLAERLERYKIESIRINVPLQPSIFNTSRPPSGPGKNNAVDEEKLKEIIKSFEQKYGQ